MIERDPITTAKEVASVDHLSGGRFEFGVGAGWNREEMANHGTDPRRRMALMAERVEAMKAIWTEDEASYQGEFVDFERIWSWPKPAQRPHPPILVGGNGPTVLDRVLRFGDAWFPNYGDRATSATGWPSCAPAPSARSRCRSMGIPAKPATIEEHGRARRQPRRPLAAVRQPGRRSRRRWSAGRRRSPSFTGEA